MNRKAAIILLSLCAIVGLFERTKKASSIHREKTIVAPVLPTAYGKEFWRGKQAASTRKPNPKFAALPFDPLDVIERASHAWSADLSVESDRYSARISKNGLELTSIRPNTEHASATFSTKNRPRTSAPILFGNVVETKLDDSLIEHFEARREGVFATWILDRRPQQAESFRIEAELTGLDYKGQNQRGHYFANASGAGFLIGNATAVDSAGKSWALTTVRNVRGELQISVPKTILDSAVYPLAIDPLISPEAGIDVPVDALEIDEQTYPSVAFNGQVYVAVWSSFSNYTGEYWVRWARFDENGHRLGPSQTLPITRPQPYSPQVASDGKEFLVVYATSTINAGISETYGVFLDAMGNLKANSTIGPITLGPYSKIASNGTNYLLIATYLNGKFTTVTPVGFGPLKDITMDDSISQLPSSVQIASDGADYFAVWQVPENGVTIIKGARISSQGEILQAPFRIGPTVEAIWPTIAYNGGSYLLGWRNSTSFGTTLSAARFDTSGARIGPDIIITSTAEDGVMMVGPHGDGFLATYFHYESNFSTVSLRAARISATGVLSPAVNISTNVSFGTQDLAVNATGLESFVVWGDIHAETGSDLEGKLISAGTPGPLEPVSEGANVETSPAVAHGSDGYLVVWQDNRWAVTNRDDIFGIYVDQNGVAKSGPAFPIATGVADQSSPDVAANLGHYLVVWREETNGFSSDDIKGAILINSSVAKTISICTETNAQRAVAVAGNGKDFLVVWRDNRSNADDDIYGAHVTFDGDVTGLQNGFAICAEPYNQQAPVVASNGTNYLVAWRDSRNIQNGTAGDDIYGAIVEPLATTLPASIAISTANDLQRAPDVASNGADYYVVWRDDRDPNQASLVYGAPVSHSGEVMAPAGIGVAIIPNASQREPAICRLGDGYLTAWLQNDGDNPAIYKVYSRRIGSNGTPIAGGARVSGGSHDSETLATGGGTVDRALILSQSPPQAAARILATQVCLTNCPIFLTIVVENGAPTAIWNAEANAHYRLESKDNLSAPAWQLVKEITPTAEGFISVPDSAGLGAATRFYRAVRLP